MTKERLKVVPAVYITVLKDREVLLLRRFQTGYLDGYWDLPSGHVEAGETLKECCVRELKEEAGLKTKAFGLKLIHVYQNFSTPESPYFGYIFRASRWTGKPSIQEPTKCNDLSFFPLNKLPLKTVPQVREALKNVNTRSKVTFSLLGANHIILRTD
ncbi:NUDIX domain-containing protein [Candidatus Saccharibacteria bacterium]|nr:NUDIX domain-containing protein [Candidatus Saccharibacteria bacterium]